MEKWFSDDHGFAEGKGNNRAVQPLNRRKVYYSGSGATALLGAAIVAITAALTF